MAKGKRSPFYDSVTVPINERDKLLLDVLCEKLGLMRGQVFRLGLRRLAELEKVDYIKVRFEEPRREGNSG